MAKKKSCSTPQEIWERVSMSLVHGVEALFYRLGLAVARRPWRTLALVWLFILVSAAGLMRFHIEKNPMKLWVPPDSDFFKDTNWYIDTFGSGLRFQKVLITADNVLDPAVLAAVHSITQQVNTLSVTQGDKNYTIKDLCYKVPVVNIVNFLGSNPSSSSGKISSNESEVDYSDPTLWLNHDFYCDFLKNFPYVCLQENILDLWKNDLKVISNLTNHDIVTSVNTVNVNPETGHPVDYKQMLGGVKYGESGQIVSAESVVLTWHTVVNMSSVDLNEVGNLVGTEDWVSLPLAKWEIEFLALLEKLSHNSSDINVYYEAGRSFGDISGSAMFSELDKLFAGIFLMFIYIQFAMSRCNWLEIRLTLGSVGLLSVGMAYVSAVSWCSAFGVSFGPVHSSLPFLLMGLGVDDMFVMKACWEQLTPEEMKKSVPVKVGLMLKHAGVSIVITSFTDIVALLIGAITILPSLQSFCIYAAAGVFFIFCYTVTFYVAVFTLDLRRIESNRNGLLFCYKHKKPVKMSTKKSVLQGMFTAFYRRVVFTTPFKTLVILFTIVMTGFSIEAIFRLEQRFDPKWFIPEGTYYGDYLQQYDHYYPNEGHMAMVFLGDMKYKDEFPKLHDMVLELDNQTYVRNMSSWVDVFHKYMLKNYDIDVRNTSSLSDEEFNMHVSRFLFSPIGGRFQLSFKFEKPFDCGSSSSNITASTMMFKFPRFAGPNEYIPAMNNVKDIVKSTDVESGHGYRSVWSKVFANWVTDEVIAVEVERNLELALLCVMVCTIILITNLQMCFWIFLCVLLTIVNVLGWMQRWGMTVDIVCCIGLELAIGLCVDYAAHVGHTFLTISQGSRSERSFQTVTTIGTAVLLGGGSTILSLSLLSMTKAYTFQAFFKIFALVITFGLFNGLVFLPVVLSLIGPGAYKSKDTETENPFEVEELNDKSKQSLKGNSDDID
ncbi:hypothetical protein JYU34_006545 [Plutella xylostella]|uniref:SSD domain-containing protein n=1 Tax=Plutella xylostella TaxID=51655 RepID=A0ABQ7QSB4_PLUXY|nr:hypothetical protein JYU34_006545 [Plutella xylostella]